MKTTMIKVLGMTAMLGMVSSHAVAASPCDADLKAVDAALISAKLDPASLKKVQDLRSQSAKAATDNKTADCLKTIAEAKKLLGVK